MNTQNSAPDASASSGHRPSPRAGNGDKFPEPRAWALKWDTQSYDPLPDPGVEPEPPESAPKSGNGNWDKFPHPRGWALKWDGDTITEIQDFYNPPDPSQPGDSQGDGA